MSQNENAFFLKGLPLATFLPKTIYGVTIIILLVLESHLVSTEYFICFNTLWIYKKELQNVESKFKTGQLKYF